MRCHYETSTHPRTPPPRRRPALPLVVLLCAALTCVAALVAGLDRSAPIPIANAAGALVTTADLALQIDVVRPADDVLRAAGRFNPPPPPGHESVLIYVSAECGALLCRLSPQQFTLRDRAGASVEPRQRTVDDPLVSVTLRRGESFARRALVFEAPVGAEGLRLVHRAGLFFGTETAFAVP